MVINMSFDFDTLYDRKKTNSLKWDVAEHELPMWVADMDFKTAPAIIDAMEQRVRTGIYGYGVIPDDWKEAIGGWWKKRHSFSIEKDWTIFCTGVVPAITCAVQRLTNVGDNVLVQTPVYNTFFNSIENHGRHVLENKLKYNGEQYSIDFEDLERKLSRPLTTMMILCNPHNPIGKIWSKEDLGKIGDLCKKHHVVVLSDEIHCDLTEPGCEYIPFASVSETNADNSITCISASKSFNLAGLQSAAVIIPNEALRQIMDRGLNSYELAEPNFLAVDAVISAFTKGEEWLDELRTYLSENKKMVADYLEKENLKVKLVPSDATYLLWIDCCKVSGDSTELCSFIRKETGLYLLPGSQYRGNGKEFLRMNVACPKTRLKEALLLLKQGIEAYEKRNVE